MVLLRLLKSHQYRRFFVALSVFGLITLVTVFAGTMWSISSEVRNRCNIAQELYEGDCVEALSQVVDDESQSFSDRNYAIWTLGILGDSRAKAVLEKHYTGNIPEREPYDAGLSQYELKKALRILNGGTNIGGMFLFPT